MRVIVCDLCKAERDEDCCQVGPSRLNTSSLPYRNALADHLAHCARNVEALTARAERAEARLAEAREVLRSVRTYGGWCVYCDRAKCAPDCRLRAVLGDEP